MVPVGRAVGAPLFGALIETASPDAALWLFAALAVPATPPGRARPLAR